MRQNILLKFYELHFSVSKYLLHINGVTSANDDSWRGRYEHSLMTFVKYIIPFVIRGMNEHVNIYKSWIYWAQ